MHRMFRPFHKLQWQLSLSYVLVVAISIPLLFGMGLALVALTPSPTPAQQLAQLLARDVAPDVPSPIDGRDANARATLNSWAINLMEGQNPGTAHKSVQVSRLNAAKTLAVIVIDNTGRVTGSDPVLPSNDAAIDSSSLTFFLQKMRINAPASQQIIRAAFANEQNLADLVNTLPDGQTLAAAPVLDKQQNVQGVLFVSVRGLRNDPQVSTSPLDKLVSWLHGNGPQPSTGLITLLPYALLLLFVFSVIGTLLGIFTARRITRRLQRITTAAHAWSLGNFQALVSDHLPDELGQLSQDLNRMAQQIAKLLDAQQQLAQLQERQRVARDLHDSVKQQAFALTLLIGAARSRLLDDLPSAQEQLRKAGELADQIRQELTSILQQLRPVALVKQDLQAALCAYIRQWSQQTGIACEFQGSDLPGGPVFLPEIEEALFRMAQEALTNVARHSRASQVRVQLEQRAEQVCLHVWDNGKGFMVEQATGSGHGLANMRDRMEAYGGALHIKSVPGETVVTGCIVLAQERRELRNKRRREHV